MCVYARLDQALKSPDTGYIDTFTGNAKTGDRTPRISKDCSLTLRFIRLVVVDIVDVNLAGAAHNSIGYTHILHKT